MKLHIRCLFVAGAVLLLPALPHAADPSPSSAQTVPKGHPAIPAPQQKPSPPLTGKVLKTMDSGGYTYIHLHQKKGKKIWVAIPKGKIKVGQKVELVPGKEMKNFRSDTLKRTFDSIVFSLGPVPKEVKAAQSKPGAKPEHIYATQGSKGAMVPAEKVKVEKATGRNTHTIAELFAQKAALDGKTVVVRGKIVKISPRIMKSNWIHLQDGTGSTASKNHDLVVRTKALPAMGETVTVTGTLLKDKNFGSGYRYDVIIDNGEIGK